MEYGAGLDASSGYIQFVGNPHDRRQKSDAGDPKHSGMSRKCRDQKTDAQKEHYEWQLRITITEGNNYPANPRTNSDVKE